MSVVDDQSGRERQAIRKVFSMDFPSGALRGPSDIELIVMAYRNGVPGDAAELFSKLQQLLGQDSADDLIPILENEARRRNRSLGLPSSEMQKQLRVLEFGLRVLELKETKRAPQAKAFVQAYEEMGLPAISVQSIRETYWEPFVQMVAQRNFVPYFSLDPKTGTLAPTKYVPSDLKGKRGRPKGATGRKN